MSLQDVKAFYQRLADDESFRNQIQNVKSKEECSQIVRAAGYDFTQQEYEEYTIQLLETDGTAEELKDLSEQELEAVFGGTTFLISDKYYSDKHIDPIYPRSYPMYGVVLPKE
jgi:predicted ribosomally synthesized peptide with nif11-like leader